MTEKRKKLLLSYGVVIVIILIAIMFIIPDSAFKKLYTKNIEKIQNQEIKEFTDYDTQKRRLSNKKYKYEYLLLDSLSYQTYTYKCTGTIDETVESGTCTEPEKISYTEATKKEALKINTQYVDIDYLFSIISGVEPELTKYQTTREYKYKTAIEKLDTDIIIYTDMDDITKIEISNKYMSYIIKISDIVY